MKYEKQVQWQEETEGEIAEMAQKKASSRTPKKKQPQKSYLLPSAEPPKPSGLFTRPPRKYPTPELFQERLCEYFATCDAKTIWKTTRDGHPFEMPCPDPYTIPSILVFLDISHDTWNRYTKRENYAEICEWATLKCEADIVRRGILGIGSAPLQIFYLKNRHKYTDVQKIDQNNSGESKITFVWGEK